MKIDIYENFLGSELFWAVLIIVGFNTLLTFLLIGVIKGPEKPVEVTVDADGNRQWWLYELRHREHGPAVERADGTRQWWCHDQLHREDGPAIECPDGHREWWVRGQYMTREEFDAYRAARNQSG